MKKWAIPLAAAIFLTAAPASAQQDELAKLRAEVAAQQAAVAKLLARIDALEKKLAETATRDELEDEAKTQQDAVNSVRETLLGRVNLSGYSNFRFQAEEPETPSAFQLDHLGLILGKQQRRWSFLAELEFSNVPHHAESVAVEEHGDEEAEGEESDEGDAHGEETDISGEGQVAVENAWIEYNHNRYFNVRVGKQLSPQYWWQHRYPNLTYSTTMPIYLRELFPPELIGVMVRGQVTRPVGASEFGIGYSVYTSNNNFEGNSQSDLREGKAWGARVQFRFPTAGMLKRLDVAADLYRGHSAFETDAELTEDNVNGFEGQLEFGRMFVNGEYARGESEGVRRTGYYFQPAVQLHRDWIGFYRLEDLESPRLQRAERRHLAGVNYRPFAQVAVKGEWYRSIPLDRSFIVSEEERKPFNGFAAAAVFFF
ncbi:MAG TPA: hypothetical protein VJ691_09390 [Vicinamibacterales bacterium]|nr:hypothetical protein [Vicinamibacterales bacterium]